MTQKYFGDDLDYTDLWHGSYLAALRGTTIVACEKGVVRHILLKGEDTEVLPLVMVITMEGKITQILDASDARHQREMARAGLVVQATRTTPIQSEEPVDFLTSLVDHSTGDHSPGSPQIPEAKIAGVRRIRLYWCLR